MIYIFISWIIGLLGSFVLAYFIAKNTMKNNPNIHYTRGDLFDIQYELGGPLAIIPILNIVLLIYCIFMMVICSDKMIIKFKSWFDKKL